MKAEFTNGKRNEWEDNEIGKRKIWRKGNENPGKPKVKIRLFFWHRLNLLKLGIRDFGKKCRKLNLSRARFVKHGFEALHEIDQKVKGTPFARN